MVIKEYGDKSLPKIVLLQAMLLDGKTMLKLVEGMSKKYCFIAPDLSGQGSDKGEFESAEKEANTLTEYLINKGYTEIELIMGASLGGVIGMLMISDSRIKYKTAVFDGTPLYENARVIYQFMKFSFVKKRRKAIKGLPFDLSSSLFITFCKSSGSHFDTRLGGIKAAALQIPRNIVMQITAAIIILIS